MIKAVIFDMDGVVADTELLESKAWEKILKEHKKMPILETNGLIHISGIAGDQSYKYLKRKYNLPDTIEILKNKKRKNFEEIIKNELISMDGISALLKEFKNNKYKLALASNRNLKHIYLILEKISVKDYFKVIVGQSKIRKYKPHPDIYLETAKQLSIKPENCVAIEDTAIGVQSAKAAGMKIIAVPTKYTKDADFSKADRVVNSLQSVTMELINSL